MVEGREDAESLVFRLSYQGSGTVVCINWMNSELGPFETLPCNI